MTSPNSWVVGKQEVETSAHFDGTDLAKSSADSCGPASLHLLQFAGGDHSVLSWQSADLLAGVGLGRVCLLTPGDIAQRRLALRALARRAREVLLLVDCGIRETVAVLHRRRERHLARQR